MVHGIHGITKTGIPTQATGDVIWISAVTLDGSLVENDKDFLTNDQPTM